MDRLLSDTCQKCAFDLFLEEATSSYIDFMVQANNQTSIVNLVRFHKMFCSVLHYLTVHLCQRQPLRRYFILSDRLKNTE